MSRAPKDQRYYAVRKGHNPGVYTDVNEYRAQVDGFPGASSRMFTNEQEAIDFAAGKITETEIREERSRNMRGIACPLSKENQNNWDLRWRAAQTVAAYVDGSHDDEKNKCGYGVVITTGDGREIMLYGIDKEASKAGMKSVASEVAAIIAAIQWAQMKKVKKIIILYDCASAVDALSNDWVHENQFMRKFISYYREVINSQKLQIEFQKIDGHVGNKYHELADALSRYALGKEIKPYQRKEINKIIPIKWELEKPKEKQKQQQPKIKKENYDKWCPRYSIYKIDFNKNKVLRGNVISVYRDGNAITHLTATFNGQFFNISRSEFGVSVFMHRTNAEKAKFDSYNS